MKIDLPDNVWAVLHGMMMDDPIPRRAQVHAISAFEAALKVAQQPPAQTEEPAE